MALDKLVDSAKLDACNTAEADAIRAKTGGSSPIPYDYANNKGFADAIAAIPSGGGGVSKVTSITLTAELNSYNILQAMGAKLHYQNSIVSMYVIGNTAAVGGVNYTNNNYTMVHKGTTVLKDNARYSFLDQYPSRIAPSEMYIGQAINASRYVASDAFVNADGSFSFRRAAASVLSPIGATCVLIETPLLDSAGNFDITPFST